MITTHSTHAPTPRVKSAALLRWDFSRGQTAVTCEVRVNGAASYDVCVVPHWNVSSSTVERFDQPLAAFHRHAEIASSFREAGFSVNHSMPVQH